MFSMMCILSTLMCPVETIHTHSYHEITAYTLSVDETDDTPCIGAGNNDLCKALKNGESICATNFVPLGTFLYIEGYGRCKVADRMNRKYKDRIDILMHTKKEAFRWGVKTKKVRILDYERQTFTKQF